MIFLLADPALIKSLLKSDLYSKELVFRHQEDDVLGPVDLRPEELGGGQESGYTTVCTLGIDITV